MCTCGPRKEYLLQDLSMVLMFLGSKMANGVMCSKRFFRFFANSLNLSCIPVLEHGGGRTEIGYTFSGFLEFFHKFASLVVLDGPQCGRHSWMEILFGPAKGQGCMGHMATIYTSFRSPVLQVCEPTWLPLAVSLFASG